MGRAAGAVAYAVDISPPIVHAARSRLDRLRAAVADVRRVPFRDHSFDAAYSMGTVELFAAPEQALAQLYRTLRPGGRAIIGVPNRHDPFLRPLLVAVPDRTPLSDRGRLGGAGDLGDETVAA